MEIYKKTFKNFNLKFVEMYWFKTKYYEKYLEISYFSESNTTIMNLDDKIPIWIEYEKIPLYEFVFNNLLFKKLFDENNLKDYKELKKENDEIRKLFLIIKKELLEITGIH